MGTLTGTSLGPVQVGLLWWARAVVFRACLLMCVLTGPLAAEVALGSTREQVIAAFGPPRGTTKAGCKEILTCPQGRVVRPWVRFPK